MRGDEHNSAVKVWGHPDFYHLYHDKRMYGDIDVEHDTVVFGAKGHVDYICPYSDQDHERN